MNIPVLESSMNPQDPCQNEKEELKPTGLNNQQLSKSNKDENSSQRQQSNILCEKQGCFPFNFYEEQSNHSNLFGNLYVQFDQLNEQQFDYLQFQPISNSLKGPVKEKDLQGNEEQDSDQQEQQKIFVIPHQSNRTKDEDQEKSQGQSKQNKLNNSSQPKRKNIIKNFGRNTIRFVQRSSYIFAPWFKQQGKNYLAFLPILKLQRKKINTIKDLRNLWVNEEYGSLMRTVSEHFFRKKALSYIFNSKIRENVLTDHMICRQILRSALRDPKCFTNLSN